MKLLSLASGLVAIAIAAASVACGPPPDESSIVGDEGPGSKKKTAPTTLGDESEEEEGSGAVKRSGGSDDDETIGEEPETNTTLPSGACNTTQLSGASVSSDYDPTFPTPLGAGGSLTDGTYRLTAWSKFQGNATPSAEQRRETLVVREGGTVLERTRQTGSGAVERTTYSVGRNGMTARLVFTSTCQSGGTKTESYSYRAIGDELTLYDTVTKEGFDYAR